MLLEILEEEKIPHLYSTSMFFSIIIGTNLEVVSKMRILFARKRHMI